MGVGDRVKQQETPTHSDPTGRLDNELGQVVAEEESCLARVHAHLDGRVRGPAELGTADYDRALLELRDEMASARLEDVPPLLEQMERLQSLASRRRTVQEEGQVDSRSPYFGRLVLKEGARQREVLIGRSTYLDTDSGIRIVDWRDAPVSRLYYRYEEGDEYSEVFGDREVEGEVLTRRGLTIVERALCRISCPQGILARSRSGEWRCLEGERLRLQGGQGSALRAKDYQRPTRMSLGERADTREDKHLREITALIDRHQFDLITRPDSSLVIIQGGAGSGKTTIGLHRLAYLAFQDPRRFRPDRMLVIVFNEALARYISLVLPALDVAGVPIRTFEDWAARLRASHLPELSSRYSEDTPVVVTRMKKHPAMLRALSHWAAEAASRLEREILATLGPQPPERDAVLSAWRSTSSRPFAHRVHALASFVRVHAGELGTDVRVSLERLTRVALLQAQDVVGAWSDLLTDLPALERTFAEHAPGDLTASELKRAHAWCTARCAEVVNELEARGDHEGAEPSRPATDEEVGPTKGIDGREVEPGAALDREDDALLLRLVQCLRGPLMRGLKGKEALVYEHVFVDEAQDLSPVELAVVMDTVSKARSVTLAGDVAQRLHMDNGFTTWGAMLDTMALSHVAVEPLRLSYRSTAEILDFAQAVLGQLAPDEPPLATRTGAPVELFSFGHSGECVAFLAEALREVMQTEPQASVAVIARYPEQAEIYYAGLRKAEVRGLRRVANQDFVFKPGVDVTDVRQVKGLEFDYVVLVEVSEASYPLEDEARHLLHIGATRAAHLLWVLATGRPSPLLPPGLLSQAY